MKWKSAWKWARTESIARLMKSRNNKEWKPKLVLLLPMQFSRWMTDQTHWTEKKWADSQRTHPQPEIVTVRMGGIAAVTRLARNKISSRTRLLVTKCKRSLIRHKAPSQTHRLPILSMRMHRLTRLVHLQQRQHSIHYQYSGDHRLCLSAKRRSTPSASSKRHLTQRRKKLRRSSNRTMTKCSRRRLRRYRMVSLTYLATRSSFDTQSLKKATLY